MDKIKLKPCPFCGEKEDIRIEMNGPWYEAKCCRCGARAGMIATIEGAQRTWNTRALLTPPVATETDYEIVRVPKDCIPKTGKLVEAYETETQIIVCGDPADDDDSHDCDNMGCGSLSHVIYRFNKRTSPLLSDLAEQVGRLRKVCPYVVSLKDEPCYAKPYRLDYCGEHDCHGTGLLPLGPDDRVDLVGVVKVTEKCSERGFYGCTYRKEMWRILNGLRVKEEGK